jgi:hypothetical protein
LQIIEGMKKRAEKLGDSPPSIAYRNMNKNLIGQMGENIMADRDS